MPVMVAFIGVASNLWNTITLSLQFQTFVLIFWPSSIFLISLDASKRPVSDVIYVWSMAIVFNILLYCLVGLLFLAIYRIATRLKA